MDSLFIPVGLMSTALGAAIGYGTLIQKVKSLDRELTRLDDLISPFGERIARLEERSIESLSILKEVRDFYVRTNTNK